MSTRTAGGDRALHTILRNQAVHTRRSNIWAFFPPDHASDIPAGRLGGVLMTTAQALLFRAGDMNRARAVAEAIEPGDARTQALSAVTERLLAEGRKAEARALAASELASVIDISTFTPEPQPVRTPLWLWLTPSATADSLNTLGSGETQATARHSRASSSGEPAGDVTPSGGHRLGVLIHLG